MKKTLSVLLIVATVLLVVVSCNAEQKFTENLVQVNLSSLGSKDLNGTVDFDVNTATVWKYTAVKQNGGLKTGEKTTQTVLTNGKTEALSQGYWNFNLYGYKVVDGVEKLICTGFAEDVKITVAEHTVSIFVKPSQTAGEKGELVIASDIQIVSNAGTASVATGYTQSFKVYEGTTTDGKEVTDEFSDNKATLDSGSYYVLVTLTGSEGGTQSGAVLVNIYDNLTTTVTGSIKEDVTSADITKKAEVVKASEKVTVAVDTSTGKNTGEVKFAVESTPSGVGETITSGSTTVEKKTTVSFPEGALQVAAAGSSESADQEVSLEITSVPIEIAASSSDYTVTGTSSEGNAVVAGFDFNLTGVESTDFAEPVVVETYIQTGLGDKSTLAISYVGEGDDTNKATILDYNSSTGYLKFQVYHFSKYAIISDAFVATDNNGKLYASLDAALEASNNITLLKDVDLGSADPISVKHTLTLNLNGKKITSTNRVFWVHEGIMTIENGTIEASISDKDKSVIRVSCPSTDTCGCTGDNLGLIIKSDAVIKGVSSYGVSVFGDKDATVSVYGTIESANATLAGNGSQKAGYTGKFIFNVYNGANLTATGDSSTYKDASGIYQPDNDVTLNIYGGNITSKHYSAVEIRAGVANISGGTLKSEASAFSSYSNTNGVSTMGVALAVSPHCYKPEIKVIISGGSFVCTDEGKELAVVNPENNDETSLAKVSVTTENNVSFDIRKIGIIDGVNDEVKKFSVWSGEVIADGSGLSENWFDAVPLDFYKYNAETDTEYRDTYKNWFKEQFFDTGKASYEERKLSAESTENDEYVMKIYDADLFASFNLIYQYLELLVFDAENWTRIKSWTILVDVDLDFDNKTWTPLNSRKWGSFVFDFNNHKISNLFINSDSTGDVGFFSEVNGKIKNLVIDKATVSALKGNNVGILAGSIKDGCEISNVTVKNSTVEGAKYVGGIVGHAWGLISGCKADNVTAKAPEQVGAIVGYIEQGGLTNCIVSGSTVEATDESAGGVAGKAYACNGSGKDVPVTNNTVSNTTIKVGQNVPTTNIGFTNNGYCGYIVGGKYINGKSGNTTTSGLETVEYDGGSGITTVKDNSYL